MEASRGCSIHTSGLSLALYLLSCPWPRWLVCEFWRPRNSSSPILTFLIGHQLVEDNITGSRNSHLQNTSVSSVMFLVNIALHHGASGTDRSKRMDGYNVVASWRSRWNLSHWNSYPGHDCRLLSLLHPQAMAGHPFRLCNCSH